jgi:hypothetical protein
MDRSTEISALKQLLLKEVDSFYRNDKQRWKNSAVRTLRDLREIGLDAVFFGGMLRSLLVSRYYERHPGRPRDIDIVFAGSEVTTIVTKFQESISRLTRFGGIKFQNYDWQFDIWPLEKTWTFMDDASIQPTFENLPYTTFFNLEAIAVDVWTKRGKARTIYAGDDQFFKGILSKTLEVNKEANPFPGLCVVRALVLSNSIEFKLGPKLCKYVAKYGADLTTAEIEGIQKEAGKITNFQIPSPTQLDLWQRQNRIKKIRFHSLYPSIVRVPTQTSSSQTFAIPSRSTLTTK